MVFPTQGEIDWAVPLAIWVRNHEGNRRAEDVEVFISVYRVIGTPGNQIDDQVLAAAETLSYDVPQEGRSKRTTATVPAGFGRRIPFALIGDPGSVRRQLGVSVDSPPPSDAHAALALTYPQEAIWLQDGVDYPIEVTVTGSNIPSQTYVGLFGVVREGAIALGCRWLEPLRPAEKRSQPRRLEDWGALAEVAVKP